MSNKESKSTSLNKTIPSSLPQSLEARSYTNQTSSQNPHIDPNNFDIEALDPPSQITPRSNNQRHSSSLNPFANYWNNNNNNNNKEEGLGVVHMMFSPSELSSSSTSSPPDITGHDVDRPSSPPGIGRSMSSLSNATPAPVLPLLPATTADAHLVSPERPPMKLASQQQKRQPPVLSSAISITNDDDDDDDIPISKSVSFESSNPKHRRDQQEQPTTPTNPNRPPSSVCITNASRGGNQQQASPSAPPRSGSLKNYPSTLTTATNSSLRSPPIYSSPSPSGASTILSPTMTQQSPSKSDHSVVTIEHLHGTKEKSTSSRLISCCLNKKILGLVVGGLGLWAVLATAGGSYLLQEYLTLPSLYDDIINGLEDQVDELTTEVDRLNGEVDKLSNEVTRLSLEVDRLTSSNEKYETLNERLENNNKEYKELNQELSRENEKYQDLNDDLNQTVMELESTKNELQNDVENLTRTVDDLSAMNQDLNQTVNKISDQNAQYEKLIEQQTTLLSFLNDTASDIDDTYDSIVSYLDSQIRTYASLVVQNLQFSYDVKVDSWRCDLNDAFGSQEFASNPDVSIGIDDYPNVMAYVGETLFEEICLNETDFLGFMERVHEPELAGALEERLTLAQLTSGVKVYYSHMEDHYFPDGLNRPDDALTIQEWVDAGYQCEGLPVNRTFIY